MANPTMGSRKVLFRVGTVLIYAGLGLFACVGSVYLYGRFEEWLFGRPQALAFREIILPKAPQLTPIPLPTSTRLMPTPTPTQPAPTPGPAVRIEIPKISVSRAIIPIGTVNHDGALEWDTDKLFATSGRLDLVGHLEGTANPGQIGNVVLTGHNYNLGTNGWVAVFYALDTLAPGDMIYLSDEVDSTYIYRVEQVEKILWPPQSLADATAHLDHIAPTSDETLTLITCNGGNWAPFPARVYVTAKRVFSGR